MYDLICMGGGVAGWTAALRAQELGLDVLVLEKHTTGPGWGNGRISGGFFHAAFLDPRRRTPDEIFNTVVARTKGGRCSPEVARAFADHVRRALEFLDRFGEFAPIAGPEFLQNALQPVDRASGQWKDRGPDLLLTSMWQAFTAGGGTFIRGRRGSELVADEGCITGLVALTGGTIETYSAHAVLLADGGFHASPELMRQHVSSGYLVRASRGSNEGDALRMGQSVGAQTVNLEWFYGHCQSRDALRNEQLWIFPAIWPAAERGIVVDGRGRRMADEGHGDESMAHSIARSDTPMGCWVILDDRQWAALEGFDPLGLGSPTVNPDLERLGGTVIHATELGQLAMETGLPEGELRHTLGSFLGRTGPEESPPRSGNRPEFTGGGFVAIPVVAGVTFTMGGLLVNGFAQVIANDGTPITGLYAAGGAMGGLQGGPEPGAGYCGGWSEASTFGLLAAEHVAGVLT